VETRLASLTDAPQLAALHGDSFAEGKWTLTQITDSLKLASSEAWVVEESAAPQGFILCQLGGGEAEILTFCVAPVARRKGVGETLLAAALASARQKNARRIFLEVARDNIAAAALYEKSGFRIIGQRPGYYRRGDAAVDAVMYALDL
jgi:ribosomal-protein-alanine N-acetyltransferase